MLTLRNDFHGTEARVRADYGETLSARQVARVRQTLCGIESCTCGGLLSERGPQRVRIGHTPDGTGIRLYPHA